MTLIENVYVVYVKKSMIEKEPQLFCISTMTFEPLPAALAEQENGVVLKKEDDSFLAHTFTEEERVQITSDPDIQAFLNSYIVSNNKGKSVYEVAWFAGDFSNFMQSFTTLYFEV